MATRLLAVLIKSKSKHIKGNRPADLSLWFKKFKDFAFYAPSSTWKF